MYIQLGLLHISYSMAVTCPESYTSLCKCNCSSFGTNTSSLEKFYIFFCTLVLLFDWSKAFIEGVN